MVIGAESTGGLRATLAPPGAGGLGRLLEQQRAAFKYRGMLATVIALVAVSVLVDLLSASASASAGAGARRSLR